MADVEEAAPASPPPEEQVEESPVEEQTPATPPGEKEANKPPSPKPDQEESAEVAPPLVSKEDEAEPPKSEGKADGKG